jgi:glutamate--cysteine ligase
MIKLKEKLNMDAILELFTGGCKTEQRLGIEYERLPVCAKTHAAADYHTGVCDALRMFAKEDNWDYITDDYNIIGLKQEHDTITLEPGSQLEMSLKPEEKIADIEKKINSVDKKMIPALKKHGIEMLGYGISPLSTNRNINIIPKKRYHLMAKYLWGILSDVMMRETAGVQVCVDFQSEEDAARKFCIANKLSPFMTAMFANSPVRGGVDTGYKSFRALSWLNTDNDRCGFAGGGKCFSNKFSFKDYVDSVLKSPMIYIDRSKRQVQLNGKVNFKEFMKSGWEGHDATIDDFILHANLYFPEVRLRNFIEIRNHDCVNHGLQYSLLALYKGLLYNQDAMGEVEELLSGFTPTQLSRLRFDVPHSAMQCRVGDYEVSEIAKEILCIAEKSLLQNNEGEEKYLDAIKEYTMAGIAPADVILRNWYGSWDKDVSKLVGYCRA